MARRKRPEVKLAHITLSAEQVLRDYRLASQSRQASLIGRREVMNGRARFGIFGDGKEIAQVAWARAFFAGDWRSGYYRDQTVMFALDSAQIREFFSQLYGHADVVYDPVSAGRSMNNHFASRLLNADGTWKDQTEAPNSSADLAPTGAQMPRLVGLAYASKLYRLLEELQAFTQFSKGGREVAWGTIGNASCAEGVFWEAVNAAGVLQVPMVVSIWDDGYGISVPNALQHTKSSLAAMLQGFARQPDGERGIEIRAVRGWDYPTLVDTYVELGALAREQHVPSVLHCTEMTQPQGHSTSGSHERYKDKRRLAWELAFDPLTKMRDWMANQDIAQPAELDRIDDEAHAVVEGLRQEAWDLYQEPIREERDQACDLLERLARVSSHGHVAEEACETLRALDVLLRRDLLVAVHDVLLQTRGQDTAERRDLAAWFRKQERSGEVRYASHLYSQSAQAAATVAGIPPRYTESSPVVNGFEVLNACFDAMLARDPRVVAFGEDVGLLGDVNQGFRGLQNKYGELRVTDTGIRECTILGQAIGLAVRGLRPIAEIQYLDYLLYALEIMSDDLATLHWRTKGGQKAPAIVRTRGHRLVGTWHAGSLMASILDLCRGMVVAVPRDMTRAAGFYNTLLESDDPGLVVEVLNGYRLKERLPDNIAEFRVPVGVVETIRPGRDVTVVTYGACCRIAMEAADQLATVGIDTEIVDVQCLLPFDRRGDIGQALARTGRVLFLDEDVPGGTSAFMMQQVLEAQGAYYQLDSEPRTLCGKEHRTAYATDGDYWSKPSVQDVVRVVYSIMSEVDPRAYPPYE